MAFDVRFKYETQPVVRVDISRSYYLARTSLDKKIRSLEKGHWLCEGFLDQ